jgi:hypothetical protein
MKKGKPSPPIKPEIETFGGDYHRIDITFEPRKVPTDAHKGKTPAASKVKRKNHRRHGS